MRACVLERVCVPVCVPVCVRVCWNVCVRVCVEMGDTGAVSLTSHYKQQESRLVVVESLCRSLTAARTVAFDSPTRLGSLQRCSLR